MSVIARYTVSNEEAQSGPIFNSIHEMHLTISEEAFLIGDMSNWLKRRSASISAAISDGFRKLTTFDFTRPEVIAERQLAKSLSTRKYTDLIDLTVYIPVALKQPVYPYMKHTMELTLPAITKLMTDVIHPAQKCISHYINNVDDTSERRGLITQPKFTPEQLKNLIAKEASFFTVGNRRASCPLDEAYHDIAEITNSASILNQVNQTIWGQVNPKLVEKEVAKLVELCNTLFGILDSADKTSAEFIKNITGMIDHVGSCVEWYAATLTRMADTTSALKHNEKILLSL